MFRLLILKFLYIYFLRNVYCDNFPSLLASNATLAIVIDREYTLTDYDKLRESIETFMVYAKREILKHGGVNIKYYSWANINVRKEFSAILSIASCIDTWNLFRMTKDENILLMSITEPNCERLPLDEAISIPIVKNGDELPQILLDLRIRKAFSWRSVVLIHDDSLGRDIVTRVISALYGELHDKTILASAISVLKLSNHTLKGNRRNEIITQIKGLPLKQVGRNFLVIVQLDIIATLLEISKTLQMTTPKSQWLYIISDTDSTQNISTYSDLLGEGENIAFVYNSTLTSNDCVYGIANQTVDVLRGFMTALDSAVREEEETSSQIPDEEWEAVRPTKEQRRDYLLKAVKQYLSVYGINGNCTRWKLQSGETWGLLYEHKNDSILDIQLLDVGYWRPSDGLNLNDVLFPHVEHGFRGRTLPLVSFHNPPWQVLKLNETGSVVEYSGVVFHIVEEIAKKLNFTFTIVFPTEERIGLAANETYNPSTIKGINIDNARRIVNESNRIIDVVRKKSVLMAACAISINNQRKHIINYTMAISTETYTFLVSRPKELSRALLFLSPFALDTWLCLGIAVASMGPILYFIHKFSPVYEHEGISQSGGLTTIHNCLWYMYGALMQQGGMYLPSADSGRLIVGTWWLVVLVVVTTYSGNLVAFLTFPKIDNPINTINDLLSHRDTVSWSILHGTSLEEFLKTTDEPKLMELHKGVHLEDEIESKMLDEVTAGRHVFIDWKINLQFIMKKEFLRTNRCDLILSSDEFLEEQVAMIVSKGNPYLPMINEQIKRLHQVGLIEKWLKDYLPKKDRCSNMAATSEVKNHTVNMNDMQGSFFVLFLGFICATFVMIIEKLWKKRVLSKEQKVIQPFMS